MTHEESLRANLSGSLALPPAAVDWLLDLWASIQGLDDLVDGAATSLVDQYKLIWTALVGMPSNPFFRANESVLLPVMANAYLKWRAAEEVERNKLADQYEKSFVWRAGFYDVVLQCVLLVHGSVKAAGLAPHVMALYGERLEDYKKEFGDA